MALDVRQWFHAVIVCTDLDRSLDFYKRVLGARVIEGPVVLDFGDDYNRLLDLSGQTRARLAHLQWEEGGTHLVLQQFDEPGASLGGTARDIGFTRTAWRVPDIDSARDWVQEQGVDIIAEIDVNLPDGRRRRAISFYDPDGILLELIEYFEYADEG